MALYVPDLDPASSMDEAALAYAAAGWYVLPIDPATKHPGSVVGKGWPAKSSRDPQQIIGWLAGSRYGLALHVGRSGAVVFDVDDPDAMPVELSDTLYATDPPFQSTREGVAGRGHYLYLATAGRNFSNGTGKLSGAWGEVRGRNGVIVAFPTPHSKAGGCYRWVTTGPLPPLPDDLAALLPEATDADAAATDAETAEFLVGHVGASSPELVDKLIDKLEARYAAGESRHQTFVDIATWGMREARAGLYPALPVANRLREQFVSWMAVSRDGSERIAGTQAATTEFLGILAWAVAQAKRSNVEDVLREVNGRTLPASLTPMAVMLSGARHLASVRASSFTPRRVRWGWADRMPVGELTLVPGREGVGKSLFLAWLAAQLTQGTLPGEWEGTPRDVMYVASEDSWDYTIVPRMMAAGADLSRVHKVDAVEASTELSVMLPLDCHLIADLAIKLDAAALMLDPIVSLIDDRLSVNQTRELRRALEPLRRAAERARIIVPALAHFNKTTDTDVLSKIPGGRAWAEVARAAIGVADDKDGGTYVCSQIKNNLGQINLPNLTYMIESVAVTTADGAASVGRLKWTGETETSVDDVLSRKPERRGRETSSMTQALIAYIEEEGRPLSLAEIYARFPLARQGTVRMTLTRAADRGDVTCPARGFYGPADRA